MLLSIEFSEYIQNSFKKKDNLQKKLPDRYKTNLIMFIFLNVE